MLQTHTEDHMMVRIQNIKFIDFMKNYYAEKTAFTLKGKLGFLNNTLV